MNMGKVEASERAEFDSSLIDPGRMLNQAETPEDKKYSTDSWFSTIDRIEDPQNR